MFTLHVAWLLVSGVPGLLMLAAFGLGRLERGLPHGPVDKPASAHETPPARASRYRAPRHTEPRGNPLF